MEDKRTRGKNKYTLGALLKNTRRKKRISRKELSRGIMPERILIEIEENRCIVDKFTWDFLLSRIGVSTNIYECYVTEEEWKWYQLQIKLRNIANDCLRILYENNMLYSKCDNFYKKMEENNFIKIKNIVENGRKYLQEYKNSLQNDSNSEGLFKIIHILFLEVMEGYFLMAEGVEGSIRLERIEKVRALLEIEPFHQLKRKEKSTCISIFELELFILMADLYVDMGQYESAKEILVWICTYSYDYFKEEKEELVKIYPYAAWRLAKVEELANNNGEIVNICLQAMKLLVDTKSLRGMVPIMDVLLKYWNDEITLSICSKEKMKEQRGCIIEVFTEYKENPYGVYPLMDIKNATLVTEVIKQKREVFQMTQVRLSEGIMEPETLSRFENRKQKVRWKRVRQLLEKLSLPVEKERLYLESNNAIILGKYQKIATRLYQNEIESARRELAILEEQLDKESKRNVQYLLFTNASTQNESYNIDEIELKKICEEALKITMINYPNIKIKEEMLSRQEGIILNNIAILYQKKGRGEEALKLFADCNKSYSKGTINKEYFNNSQIILKENFINVIGDSGEFDTAIKLSKELLQYMLRTGSYRGMSSVIYEILWNMYESKGDRKANEVCKKLYLQSCAFAILERNKDEVKFLLERKEKYTNIKN